VLGVARLRRVLNRTQLTVVRAAREFVDDRGHREAAQIGFFAVLSAVPLGMLLVGAFGLVFDDAEVRSRVVTTVFENVPLSTEDDRDRLERTVIDALENAGSLRPLPVLLLIVAATGVMGALRHAINQAWDIEERPPLVRRKALDLALVLAVTIVLALSLSVTASRRAADLVDDESGIVAALLDGVGDVLPFVFTALTILFLYRVLPMRRQPVREIWPGALVAAALVTLLRGALELYFEEFADLGAIYGSLGALMALLLFVYAASNAIVFGAEFASEYSRLPADDEVGQTARAQRRRLRLARG
jgi:membrane protein